MFVRPYSYWIGTNVPQVLRLDDSGYRRLRKRCCGSKKVLRLRFVNVALEHFVYLGVAESESLRFNDSICIGEVRHKVMQL